MASRSTAPAGTDERSGVPGGSVVLRTASLLQADRVAQAAVDYVQDHPGLPPVFVLVVDAAGNDKASRRMDGNGAAAVAIVRLKAKTSLQVGMATADLATGMADAAGIASFTAAGFVLLGGGRPIVEDGYVIGAVAVGGGSPAQDDEIAQAALLAL